jgi:predicted GIY-YIG superfamily endonuclease
MKQFIYILTNNNRNSFQVGLTQDLSHTMHYYKEQYQQYYNRAKAAARLVYVEAIDSSEEAAGKLAALTAFTQPQKERLIRRSNPNWTDLSQPGSLAVYETHLRQLAS